MTAPSCPQCRAMLAEILRTPGIEVWDWSEPGSRRAYQRFRELHGLPRLTEPIVLPLLVSLLGGAMPAAVQPSMPMPKLAGPLPVGVLVGVSLAVWGSSAVATKSVAMQTDRGPAPVGARPQQPSLLRVPAQRFVQSVEVGPTAIANRVFVMGKPGCPPCESAYRILRAAFGQRVAFVRPKEDLGTYSRIFPRPVETASTPLRYTITIRMSPLVVVTDPKGRVVWQHSSWPVEDADAEAILRQVERVLETGGER